MPAIEQPGHAGWSSHAPTQAFAGEARYHGPSAVRPIAPSSLMAACASYRAIGTARQPHLAMPPSPIWRSSSSRRPARADRGDWRGLRLQGGVQPVSKTVGTQRADRSVPVSSSASASSRHGPVGLPSRDRARAARCQPDGAGVSDARSALRRTATTAAASRCSPIGMVTTVTARGSDQIRSRSWRRIRRPVRAGQAQQQRRQPRRGAGAAERESIPQVF